MFATLSALIAAPPPESGLASLQDAVHPERASMLKTIRNANALWTARVHDRFSHLAPGASTTLMGVKGNWTAEIHEKLLTGEIEQYRPSEAFANVEVPLAFDSEAHFSACAKTIGDIRDQSNCGCCWAFSGAEAASDRMCIATKGKMMMPLSSQDVCFNSNFNGCGGGQIYTTWSYLKNKGVVTGGQYQGTGPFGKGFCSSFSLPHCHHHGPTHGDPYPAEGEPGCPKERSPRGPTKCDSDAVTEHADFEEDKITFQGSIQTASGPDAIKQMIMEGGPVQTAFSVYTDFENYGEGIYHHVTGNYAGGHAVKIVGWGEANGIKFWKVANSWNPYWGEKGYFRIRYGEGGIDGQVIGASADATWGKKSELDGKVKCA